MWEEFEMEQEWDARSLKLEGRWKFGPAQGERIYASHAPGGTFKPFRGPAEHEELLWEEVPELLYVPSFGDVREILEKVRRAQQEEEARRRVSQEEEDSWDEYERTDQEWEARTALRMGRG